MRNILSPLSGPLGVYDKHKEFIKSEPVKLNGGETQFIKGLKDCLKKSKVNEKEILLLGNLSRQGIKFFQAQAFIPILYWGAWTSPLEKFRTAIVIYDT